MDEKSREMIRTVKSRIIACLDERQRLGTKEAGVTSPSKYWSDFCSFFDYMLWIPEESFSKLRLHTYHLTGDNYQTYYFKIGAELFKATRQELIKDVPSDYVLYEPEGGIGFLCGNGKLVSHDILRYQQVVNTLYRYGVISPVAKASEQRKLVLEIGGGYGGLAHHLLNICRNATYIIVDLPETLLFSASYLSLLNPQKMIYIYEGRDFPEFMRSGAIMSYDFVLLPNYKLDSLAHLRFDLVINVASLQEMRTSQAEEYLNFIRETCRGIFYSWNQDHQPRNKELSDLSDLLRERFELTEVLDWRTIKPCERMTTRRKLKLKLREMLKRMAILISLLDKPEDTGPDLPYKEYICKPLPLSKNADGKQERLE